MHWQRSRYASCDCDLNAQLEIKRFFDTTHGSGLVDTHLPGLVDTVSTSPAFIISVVLL